MKLKLRHVLMASAAAVAFSGQAHADGHATWASKSKASVAAIIYKMLSEGEIRSNLTFDQLKKIQRQKKVA